MHGLQVMYIKKEGVPRQGRDVHPRWWLFLLDVALETFYLLLMPDTKKYVSSSLIYIPTYIHYLKQIHTHSISTSSLPTLQTPKPQNPNVSKR